MNRKYWLDLFTGKTWEDFLKHGGTVSGFRERRRKVAEKIHPGDFLICYITGISRIIAVLNVKSECYYDEAPIYKDAVFPYRFKVEIIYKLEPETAIPIQLLKDQLSIFQKLKSPNAWSGFFRGSPAQFSAEDGQVFVEAIKKAMTNPCKREYDVKKYLQHRQTYDSKLGVVTVPVEDDFASDGKISEFPKTTHEEIQYLLLKLGSDLGLNVWVAKNDRNKDLNGIYFRDIPNFINVLPRQFDEATNRTIELIDVLWLNRDAIVAAFEVEHTTAIYSGLLRMSDLVSMQPNIKINLYMVAPDDRRDKVFTEINRPTFARLKPPLPKICKFIPYSEIKKEIEQIGVRVRFMRPEFIDDIAESCEPEEA